MSTGLEPLGGTRTPGKPARLAAFAMALLLLLLLLTHGAHARGGRDFRDRSVIGKWKLVSVLDIAAIASLDEAEAKTLLGKYVTISGSGVKVDEEVCPAPEFWAERVAPEAHIQEKLHSGSERLRLPDPAIMVELGCTDAYIRSPRELVLLWGGAMYEAVRIIPKSESKPKGPPGARPQLARNVPGKAQKPGKQGPTKIAAMTKVPAGSLRTGKPGKPEKPALKAGAGRASSRSIAQVRDSARLIGQRVRRHDDPAARSRPAQRRSPQASAARPR